MERLPAEILNCVWVTLDINAKRALSSVNSQYRSLLAPSLFSTLRFTRLEADANSIRRTVEKHGRHVKNLHYHVDLYPVKDEWNQHYHPSDDISNVSEIALDLLAGGSLSDVENLRMTFVAFQDFEGDGFGPDPGIPIDEDEQDATDVRVAETERPWRGVIKQSMAALTRNAGVKNLKLRRLPPVATSVYESTAWRQLIARLESLDIGVWGRGIESASNTSFGYGEFIANLRDWFFDQLSLARRLRFAADAQNPIGCEGIFHWPIPLPSASVPRIEHLELRHCKVDPVLVAFLVNKSRQLTSLRLIECYSAGRDGPDGVTENPVSWEELFYAIERSDPILSELVMINNSKVDHDEDEEDDEDVLSNTDEDDLDERDDGGRRRYFPYIYMDDKYGTAYTNDETEAEAVADGGDGRAFDSLMRIVRENREQKATMLNRIP